MFDEESEAFVPLLYAFVPNHAKDFYVRIFDDCLPPQAPKYILTSVTHHQVLRCIAADCFKELRFGADRFLATPLPSATDTTNDQNLLGLPTVRSVSNPAGQYLSSSINAHSRLSSQQSKQTIDDLEYKSIKCLVALMYIPPSDIVTVFEALQQLAATSIEGQPALHTLTISRSYA